MTYLRRFFALPGVEKRLLVQATLSVAWATFEIRLLPFRWVQSRLARVPFRSGPPKHRADQIVVAILRASRIVPGASCLPQAVAANRMLARNNHRSTLRIGVDKSAPQGFRAHAWLECDGRVLVGGERSLEEFTPLPAMHSPHSE